MINPIGTEFTMNVGGTIHHCVVTEVCFGMSASIYRQEPIELDMRILMWPTGELEETSGPAETPFGLPLTEERQIEGG